ncbi:putative glucose-1-phosphate adenylyltransferase [Helianthus debilis subsp. tardiflorus]
MNRVRLHEEQNVLEFLVLVGNHLYRMDYEKFIQAHRVSDANITFAALPMDEKRATSFGLMKIDEEGRIIEFFRKAEGRKVTSNEGMKIVKFEPSKGGCLIPLKVTCNVSSGLMEPDDTTILSLNDKRAKKCRLLQVWEYNVFSNNVMLDLMREKFPKANDFGSEVIPGATSIGLRVSIGAYLMYFPIFLMIYHNLGDIGTIEALYHANLGITKKPVPDFRSACYTTYHKLVKSAA